MNMNVGLYLTFFLITRGFPTSFFWVKINFLVGIFSDYLKSVVL